MQPALARSAKRDSFPHQPIGTQDHGHRMPPQNIMIPTTNVECRVFRSSGILLLVLRNFLDYFTSLIREAGRHSVKIKAFPTGSLTVPSRCREIKPAARILRPDWSILPLACDSSSLPALLLPLYKYLPSQTSSSSSLLHQSYLSST